MGAVYERDFYSWAMEQAALLRGGALDRVDLEHIAEELESLGRSEASALKSCYRLILMHLLKWQFQPEKRSNSWRKTVMREKLNLAEVLEENPGLKPRRAELFTKAYDLARKDAAIETDLPLSTFPETCPFDIEQVSGDFWP
jgi:hypothetical protein